MAALNEDVSRYLRTKGEVLSFPAVTLSKLSMATSKSFPKGTWQKAEDSRILLQWLRQWLESRSYADIARVTMCVILDELCSALCMIDVFFSELYTHGYFIADPEGRRLAKLGLDFLAKMSHVIRLCVNSGMGNLFKQQPKSHALWHHFTTMWNQCVASGACINPLAYSCQMLEDLIGKVCRLSRRVDPKHTCVRTLSTVLIAAGTAWKQPCTRAESMEALAQG